MILTTTYEVVQKGLVLSCEKIAINKYENKVTKLHFTFDENIAGGRHYIALLNPVTKTYKIYPLNMEDTATLSAEMSRFPGIWQLILIATTDDYEIVDDEIDQTKCTYVSNTAKFIIVRDNFLSDDTVEYEDSPAIQQLIDETVAMRDQLEQYALGANEDYNKTHAEAERVALFVEEAQSIKEEIEALNELIFGYKVDAEKYFKLSKAWAIGDEDIAETVENNAKYYCDAAKDIKTDTGLIKNNVSEICAHVELLKNETEQLKSESGEILSEVNDLKEDVVKQKETIDDTVNMFDDHVKSSIANFDEYYGEMKDSLKGDRGDVYLAAFKVVNGRLKMYSDPRLEKFTFIRDGSRLKYRLTI